MSNKLSLNNQYDYVTLRTPNGNYTLSRSGARASGRLAQHPSAFERIDGFVTSAAKTSSVLDAMSQLTNPDVLAGLWPEWDAPQPAKPAVGQRVRHRSLGAGVVQAARQKTATIRLESDGRLWRVELFTLELLELLERAPNADAIATLRQMAFGR